MKKGDISVNMIVVAGIALIVLLSVIFIFSGKMKPASETFSDCASRGGECKSDSACDISKNTILKGYCEDTSKPNCCVPIIT